MLRRQALEFHPDGGGKVRQVDTKPRRLKLGTKGGGRYFHDTIGPNTFRPAVSERLGNRRQHDHWIITFDDLP